LLPSSLKDYLRWNFPQRELQWLGSSTLKQINNFNFQ
jgi:hypothetical protein